MSGNFQLCQRPLASSFSASLEVSVS